MALAYYCAALFEFYYGLLYRIKLLLTSLFSDCLVVVGTITACCKYTGIYTTGLIIASTAAAGVLPGSPHEGLLPSVLFCYIRLIAAALLLRSAAEIVKLRLFRVFWWCEVEMLFLF